MDVKLQRIQLIWLKISGLCLEWCGPEARAATLKRVESSHKIPDKDGLGRDIEDFTGNYDEHWGRG